MRSNRTVDVLADEKLVNVEIPSSWPFRHSRLHQCPSSWPVRKSYPSSAAVSAAEYKTHITSRQLCFTPNTVLCNFCHTSLCTDHLSK